MTVAEAKVAITKVLDEADWDSYLAGNLVLIIEAKGELRRALTKMQKIKETECCLD